MHPEDDEGMFTVKAIVTVIAMILLFVLSLVTVVTLSRYSHAEKMAALGCTEKVYYDKGMTGPTKVWHCENGSTAFKLMDKKDGSLHVIF